MTVTNNEKSKLYLNIQTSGNKENFMSPNKIVKPNSTQNNKIQDPQKSPSVINQNIELSVVFEEEADISKASFACENVEFTDSKINKPQTNGSFCAKHTPTILRTKPLCSVLSEKDENIIKTATDSNSQTIQENIIKQQKIVDTLKQSEGFVQPSDSLRKSILLSSRLHTLEDMNDKLSSRTWGRGEIENMLIEKVNIWDAEKCEIKNDASFIEPETLCSAHQVRQMTCKFLSPIENIRLKKLKMAKNSCNGNLQAKIPENDNKSSCNIF